MYVLLIRGDFLLLRLLLKNSLFRCTILVGGHRGEGLIYLALATAVTVDGTVDYREPAEIVNGLWNRSHSRDRLYIKGFIC